MKKILKAFLVSFLFFLNIFAMEEGAHESIVSGDKESSRSSITQNVRGFGAVTLTFRGNPICSYNRPEQNEQNLAASFGTPLSHEDSGTGLHRACKLAWSEGPVEEDEVGKKEAEVSSDVGAPPPSPFTNAIEEAFAKLDLNSRYFDPNFDDWFYGLNFKVREKIKMRLIRSINKNIGEKYSDTDFFMHKYINDLKEKLKGLNENLDLCRNYYTVVIFNLVCITALNPDEFDASDCYYLKNLTKSRVDQSNLSTNFFKKIASFCESRAKREISLDLLRLDYLSIELFVEILKYYSLERTLENIDIIELCTSSTIAFDKIDLSRVADNLTCLPSLKKLILPGFYINKNDIEDLYSKYKLKNKRNLSVATFTPGFGYICLVDKDA